MLEKYYAKVRGIVHKCRKEYYLHLWEKDDWDQEGMICLYELLEHHPELVEKKKRNSTSTSKQNSAIESLIASENKKVKNDVWIGWPMKK